MISYLVVFLAVFLTDIIYTYFLRAVQYNKPMTASLWSVAVTFTASITVIEYTTNHMLLIPALFGAFFGTYVGMKFKKE